MDVVKERSAAGVIDGSIVREATRKEQMKENRSELWQSSQQVRRARRAFHVQTNDPLQLDNLYQNTTSPCDLHIS
jgi:hypothetical protein